MRRSLLVLAAAVTAGGCLTGTTTPRRVDVPGGVPTHLRVRSAAGRAMVRVPLEDYVRVTILSEFAPASGDPEVVGRMLEVQAIVARSYALAQRSRHAAEGFDLCSTTHCQLYEPGRLKTSRWSAAARTAASRTAGRILWYGTSPAETVFHADCGGHTSAARDVWSGGIHPYLAALEDDGPAREAHRTWRFAVQRQELLAALNADVRTHVGDRLNDIRVAQRDAAGRATLVRIQGASEKRIPAEELRRALTRAFGPRALRSTKFEIRRDGGAYVFLGQGFGHGVGLCQAGAFARLDAGASPGNVLNRYYPGTHLVRVR